MALYYILLFATPFHNDPRLGRTLINLGGGAVVTPIKVLGILTVAVAILAPPPRTSVPRLRNPLTGLFIVFAIIPIVTTLVFNLPVSGGQVEQLLSAALLLVATRQLVRTKERMFKVARTLVLAFAFGSLWVYKQHFIEHAASSWGLEGEPNYEALMLLLSIPMGFWMWRYEQSRWWRRIGLASAIVLAAAVPFTTSRMGVMAGAVMGLLAAFRSRRKLLSIMLLLIAALMLANFGPAALSEKFQSIKFTGEARNGDEASTRIHVELLKAGLRMMERHPVFGVGMGRFKVLAPAYNPELLEIADQSWIAHDTFIQVGAECGVPVLLLFMAMISLALHNFGGSQHPSDPALAGLGRSMQLSLIGISVAAASISVEFLPFFILMFLSQNFREIARANMQSESLEPCGTPQIGAINRVSLSLATTAA